jgi:hypothetical protein
MSMGVQVLRIDYRDVPANPGWPIRRTLDELVAVDGGLFLGQALMEWEARCVGRPGSPWRGSTRRW